MKYYLFQDRSNNTIIFMADPDKQNLIIRPYLALSHGKSYNSIEHYSECMREYWKYGLDITDLSAYSDFKMKSDSLDELIEQAALGIL